MEDVQLTKKKRKRTFKTTSATSHFMEFKDSTNDFFVSVWNLISSAWREPEEGINSSKIGVYGNVLIIWINQYKLGGDDSVSIK